LLQNGALVLQHLLKLRNLRLRICHLSAHPPRLPLLTYKKGRK